MTERWNLKDIVVKISFLEKIRLKAFKIGL